ncbi:transmembrane protein 6/97, partial [Mycotypha africana]|uniref:transmembrane protein 6/97 n=1 Tax=Mycotypha africana TaxID=64632 RepID=UPI0022FFDC7A
PILNRPIDWILFCYFVSHIPITILFDLQPLYPEWLIPDMLKQISYSYVQLTHDPFMDVSRPVMYWFKSFSICEAVLQLPFFFFAAYGVFRNKEWIRLPIAVYGAHVMTTVIPCLAEIYLNQKLFDLSDLQRNMLLCLYFPYFLIPLVGLVDSFIRIQKKI